MKKYNYLLFDWDGCIAKTLQLVLTAYKETFAEYNLYPDDKTITQEVFGDWSGPKKLGITDIEAYTKKYLKRIDEKYPSVELYDSARETIIKLKQQNKRIALLTTSKKSHITTLLHKTSMDTLFDCILTADDVRKHKPDPEIVYKALDILNGQPNEAIVIGDSKSDLGAAINAGVDSVLFYPKENEIYYDLTMLKKYNPTYTITNFIQLLKIIT